MPYILLNNSVINRSKGTENRFISVSCVIDSPISSENPKFITSIEDLDLYFEKDFTWRDYMVELLEQEVGLLLYKPVKPEKILSDIFYDYKNYEQIGPFLTEEDLPEKGELGKIYLSYSEINGPWIWADGIYCDVRNLPQNIEKISKSSENRDSLRLFSYNEDKTLSRFCFPVYSEKYDLPKNFLTEVPIQINEFNEYCEGRSSYAFDLRFDIENINFYSNNEKGYYFTLSKGNEEVLLIWFNSGNQICPLGNDLKTLEVEINVNNKSFLEIREEIISAISNFGYIIHGVSETEKYINYIIYSNILSKDRQLHDLPGFSCKINTSVSNQLLSDATESIKRIDFFSRTIGNAKEKVKIKITKSKRRKDLYTIEISKYDYFEVFTGTIFSYVGEESLDSQINKKSKIVTCKIHRYRSNGSQYKIEDLDSQIPEGTWYLSGGEDEKVNYEYYQESLEILKTFSDFKEDFLLVPNIDSYRNIPIPVDYNYFPEYKLFLDYAKEKNCQILIDNLKTGYTIKTVSTLPNIDITFNIPKDKIFIPELIYKEVKEDEDGNKTVTYYQYNLYYKSYQIIDDREMSNDYLNNFIFNYPDKDNYLVYFYDQIYLSDYSKRPGFYVFLENIITGKFETQKTRILYNSPQDERFLLNNYQYHNKLKEYKTNYLSYNNHYYYYDQLFNGDENNQSIITRYILGKIRRRIESEKWSIINQTSLSNRVEMIGNILQKIYSTYSSIIKNLSIVDIKEDNTSRTFSFTLRIVYTELINKDVYLNITLNI